jgi:hypothetical protein
MEINELTVGDLVMDGTHIAQIVSVTCDGIIGTTFNESSNIEVIEPLYPTPEILEKNGFEKVLDEEGTECYRYYNRSADGYIKISLYNGGDGDWRIEIVNYEKFDDNKIVYQNNFMFLKLHQLQHALRLCGITKEIELEQ